MNFNSVGILNAKSKKLKLKKANNKDNKVTSTKVKNTASISANNGIKINGTTFIVKSMGFQTTGFDKKSGKSLSSSDIGNSGSRILEYMNREDSVTDIESDSENSLLYDSEKQLTKEDLSQIQETMKEGLKGQNHLIISTGQDLDREENAVMVRNTMSRFKEETGKDFDYQFAFHTDKDTNENGEQEKSHSHVLMSSQRSGNDIKMNPEQLQSFKIIAAEETAKLLNEKNGHNNLENEIERAKEHLINLQKSGNLNQLLNEERKQIVGEEQYDLKISFNKEAEGLNIKSEDIKIMQDIQKEEGKKTYLERQTGESLQKKEVNFFASKESSAQNKGSEKYWNDLKNESQNKSPEDFKQEKISQVDSKISELESKLSDSNIQEKLNNLRESFLESDTAKEIHSNSTDRRIEKAGEIGKQITEETGWKDQELKLMERESNLHKDIKLTTDSALDALSKSIEELEKEKEAYKDRQSDTVNNKLSEELKNLSNIKRDSETNFEDTEFKIDIQGAIGSSQEKRNNLKSQGNEETQEFRNAQKEFMNLQLVKNDGLDLNSLDKWKEKAVLDEKDPKTGEVVKAGISEENAQQFIDNNIKHAEELQKAGIFDKDFNFVDDKSKEILYINAEKDNTTLAEINKEAYKEAQENSKDKLLQEKDSSFNQAMDSFKSEDQNYSAEKETAKQKQ